MIGRSNARRGARRLFAVLQNRRLNQHLMYTIIDEVRSRSSAGVRITHQHVVIQCSLSGVNVTKCINTHGMAPIPLHIILPNCSITIYIVLAEAFYTLGLQPRLLYSTTVSLPSESICKGPAVTLQDVYSLSVLILPCVGLGHRVRVPRLF